MENNEVRAIQLRHLKRLAMVLAQAWVEDGRPLKFDQIFFPNGISVRVVVNENRTAQDTHPLRRADDMPGVDYARLRHGLMDVEEQMADRSQDA